MQRESVDNQAFAAFSRRIFRAHVRRAADGDVEELASLVALRRVVDEGIAEAVRHLRAEPWRYSWEEIARALGVSKQTAWERYHESE